MQLFTRYFPAFSYLDRSSEAEFCRYLVHRTHNSTKRFAVVCIVLMLLFSVTDVLLGDSWLSLTNLARYTAVMCIVAYIVLSLKLNAEHWLQGWLALSAIVIMLLSITFYTSGQYNGRLGEGGPMVVAFAIAAIPIFNLQQKLLLWLLLLSSLLFIKLCTDTNTGWVIFYLCISILLCMTWQRQFDTLLRSQFKAVRLEQQKAETDQLTGLLNRRSFEQRLQQKLAQLTEGQQLSLGLLDIDHFKAYNDHYGHLDGDLVLIQLSRLLSADKKRLVVRFGGEEFILVEQHATAQPPGLLQLPQQLAAQAIPHRASPFGVLTASIGVVTLNYPGHQLTSGELMQQADLLLYQAKQQGRNQARHSVINPLPAGNS
ncbi:GGDEF domain-containing protein [Rheinheimera sp.]|uniref:GGDEF domain-containing protein n=1 Tax=Rheinheimera sp. TaxID=1869214 RepID=UPI0027331C81|nr:GGDEF domain-containing protein [Rheinheimera sp.]MDP2716369.1 GGDEF domain-containing protein [Rheinheimera sp.]